MSGTRQARHDRANRYPGHVGDLAIVETLHVAQHQRLTKRQRQLGNSSFEPGRIGFRNQLCLRCRRSPIAVATCLFLLDGHQIVDQEELGRAVLAQPGVGRVAHDGQQPGAGVSVGKPSESLKCAQACLLHNILGIGAVAGQPARKCIGIAKVGQHQRLEACAIMLAAHAGHRTRLPSGYRQIIGKFIPGSAKDLCARRQFHFACRHAKSISVAYA